jgi:hypothetical protein
MSGLQMKYFVLKPRGNCVYATASRVAMRAYAKFIFSEDEELSNQLNEWADKEQEEMWKENLGEKDKKIPDSCRYCENVQVGKDSEANEFADYAYCKLQPERLIPFGTPAPDEDMQKLAYNVMEALYSDCPLKK